MDWEYVALTWGTKIAHEDKIFARSWERFMAGGWQECTRAPFEWGQTGGACIMRRPKDEPRKWTEEEIRDLMQEVECRRKVRCESAGYVIKSNQGNMWIAKEETNG